MGGKPTHEELEKRSELLEKTVAEKARLEEAFLDVTSMFRDIFEKAADGICVCHNIPDKPYVRFSYWNPRMTEITGYGMWEINKMGWYQFSLNPGRCFCGIIPRNRNHTPTVCCPN